MPCYAIAMPLLCYAMLCYAMLCYAMLSYAMLCYAMLCYAMLCYAMLCYAMLCYAMLCYAMLCYAMLCYAMLYAMLCYAMLYVMLLRCRAVPCPAILLCYYMHFHFFNIILRVNPKRDDSGHAPQPLCYHCQEAAKIYQLYLIGTFLRAGN